MAAAPERCLHVLNWDLFVEPLALLATAGAVAPRPKQRRVRLPSIERIDRERKRLERESGKAVASITRHPDRSYTFVFGGPVPHAGNSNDPT